MANRLIVPGEEEANRQQHARWDREERWEDFWTWVFLIVGFGVPIVIRLIIELTP